MFRSVLNSVTALGVVCLSAAAAPAWAHDWRALGDDHLSATPQRGFLMACSPANPNAPGAQRDGPWIQGNQVDMAAKISVQGSVGWPGSSLSITTRGSARHIEANNLPTHATGIFPVGREDPAFAYDRNPNAIRAQDVDLALPVEPALLAAPACVPMGMVAVTLNNVALFNAVDARGGDAAAHEVLDLCHGHPERRGMYHYHDLSPCLSAARAQGGHSALLGYVIDGFGLYGPFDGPGQAEVTNAALDECHGHIGPVPSEVGVAMLYHYHMNGEFPFSVGCLRGAAVRGR